MLYLCIYLSMGKTIIQIFNTGHKNSEAIVSFRICDYFSTLQTISHGKAYTGVIVKDVKKIFVLCMEG